MSDKLSVMSGKLKDTNEKLNFTLAARADSRWVVMWASRAGGGGAREGGIATGALGLHLNFVL
jgi:hypothetical protein